MAAQQHATFGNAAGERDREAVEHRILRKMHHVGGNIFEMRGAGELRDALGERNRSCLGHELKLAL